MYLTKLVLNPLSPQVMRDLANPYELHRSLLSAFPDAAAGGPGRVLFRVEETSSHEGDGSQPPAPVILLQSEQPPDWQRSGLHREYFRERCPPKPLPPTFPEGARLKFRLRANPTVKRDGKRHGLYKEAEQVDWLRRKAAAAGFVTVHFTQTSEGNATGTKRNGKRFDITHFAVKFEGELQVTDPVLFAAAMKDGIGSGKGFGFGLLSVAKG